MLGWKPVTIFMLICWLVITEGWRSWTLVADCALTANEALQGSAGSEPPPLALPLGYHHLFYLFPILELALLSLHPSTLLFSPLDLCLSLPGCFCLHFSLAPYSCFYRSLSIRHRPRGRERLREWRAWRSDTAHRDCSWHHERKLCTYPFASDWDNSDLRRYIFNFVAGIFNLSICTFFYLLWGNLERWPSGDLSV